MIPSARLALLALSASLLFGQVTPRRALLAFAPGGRVDLKLASGDYELVPGGEGAIVVTWESPEGADPVVRLEGRDGQATVTLARTPHRDFRARVELPGRTDLRVRLTAGDLQVGAFEGNLDIALRAGDLQVAVPHPEAFGRIHASVWAGDIHAPAFDGVKEGLFRTFECRGKGAYTLRAALWAGDITLARP